MKLIIEDDEGRKTVVPFVRDEITIGRQEGNTIRLTERNVSRRHARLLRQNGSILVEDLGSYNGIRINGDRIQGQVQVNEGDLIQIGDYDLAVQREAEALAAAKEHEKTQELDALPRNGSSTAATMKMPDGATVPALPQLSETGQTLGGDEPEEANPDDVTSAPQAIDEATRRQSTAIIRMDQVEQNRPRAIVELDATEAPRLVVLNTELAGREYACVRTELKIGRTDENDIAIDHRSLSRTHCKVVREDNNEWRVIDMQSANGLMVNGESYAQSALRNGDVLELGHVKLKFVGAGEQFDASKVDASDSVVVAGGSKAPMFVAIATVVIAVAAAGAWFSLHKGPKPAHVPPPPPIGDDTMAVKAPSRVETPPPPPEELTPEEQRAQVEAKLKLAVEKIDDLDWAEARKILEGCFIGESMHPEATKLLAELKSEEPLRSAIEKADQLIEADDLPAAKVQLQSAEHTRFLQKRLAEVQDKFNRASQKKLQETTVPKVVTPPPPQVAKVVTPPPPTAAQTARADAEKLYEEARVAWKVKTPVAVKTALEKLEKCVKTDYSFPQCHKLLGAVYGQVEKSQEGAKQWEIFLKLAPEDPQAPKVRKLLEEFRLTNPSK